MNPFKWITGSRKKGAPILLSVTPPRTGQRTMLGVENLLQSIAVPEPFSLELVGDRDGVRLIVRCLDSQAVRRQIAVHYPQARVELIAAGDDPLSVPEDQEAWTMTLRSSGPDQVPFRQFRDTDLVDEGSDPMLALVGALSALRGGERIVSRLLLRSLGPQWSAAYQQEEIRRSTYRSAATEEARVNHGEIARLMLHPGADGDEGTRGRRGLAEEIVAPADDGSAAPHPASVVPPSRGLSRGPGLIRRFIRGSPRRSGHAPVCPSRRQSRRSSRRRCVDSRR